MTIAKLEKFEGAFTEGYVITRRVELVGKDRRRYRLDVFEDAESKPKSFSVKYYVERSITLSGADGDSPVDGDATCKVWVHLECPSADGPTAEAALGAGMGFLARLINDDW